MVLCGSSSSGSKRYCDCLLIRNLTYKECLDYNGLESQSEDKPV